MAPKAPTCETDHLGIPVACFVFLTLSSMLSRRKIGEHVEARRHDELQFI